MHINTKPNLNGIDRIIRLILGIAIIIFGFYHKKPWCGFIGILLLYTATTRWCPIYSLIGISSKRKGN
jgi:hypothetical protein